MLFFILKNVKKNLYIIFYFRNIFNKCFFKKKLFLYIYIYILFLHLHKNIVIIFYYYILFSAV